MELVLNYTCVCTCTYMYINCDKGKLSLYSQGGKNLEDTEAEVAHAAASLTSFYFSHFNLYLLDFMIACYSPPT